MDRMKLLLQVDSTARGLTMREGWNRMVTEGGPLLRPDGSPPDKFKLFLQTSEASVLSMM